MYEMRYINKAALPCLAFYNKLLKLTKTYFQNSEVRSFGTFSVLFYSIMAICVFLFI